MTSGAQVVDYPHSEELLTGVRQAVGLDDFGGDNFLIGLESLLSSLRRDARLPPQGRAMAVALIRRRLANRLKIEDWYKRHPALEAEDIAGPVVVTGLTRTGSTALGNMMSLDPQFRCLRGWEQENPVPPPVLGEEGKDPRRIAAQAEIERLAVDDPLYAAQHLQAVDASTEDTEVLGLEFAAQQMTLPVFSYFDWWRKSDARPVFAYHKRVAKLLQSRRPPRLWLYKAPHHKFHLDALLEAYPHARFVMTHRDPAKVVPSYTSLVTHLWPGGRENHDPQWVGPYVSRHLREGMEAAVATRKRIGDDRFIDVHHHDLNRDPFGVLERVYVFLALDLTSAVREAIAQWIARNRIGAHGDHNYTAEQYGLTVDRIRAEYDFYIKRFGVQIRD